MKMKNIAVVSLFFLSSASTTASQAAGPPAGVDVNIINESTNPVPVDVQGTLSVAVDNTSENPLYVRDVDRRTRIPVLDTCEPFIADGETSGSCNFDEVESGKRLVVEFVSGLVSYPAGQMGKLHTIIRTSNGFFQNHHLLQTFQRNASGVDEYVVSQPFRIDIKEGTRLSIRIIRSPYDTESTIGRFWLTGYLVDVEAEQ